MAHTGHEKLWNEIKNLLMFAQDDDCTLDVAQMMQRSSLLGQQTEAALNKILEERQFSLYLVQTGANGKGKPRWKQTRHGSGRAQATHRMKMQQMIADGCDHSALAQAYDDYFWVEIKRVLGWFCMEPGVGMSVLNMMERSPDLKGATGEERLNNILHEKEKSNEVIACGFNATGTFWRLNTAKNASDRAARFTDQSLLNALPQQPPPQYAYGRIASPQPQLPQFQQQQQHDAYLYGTHAPPTPQYPPPQMQPQSQSQMQPQMHGHNPHYAQHASNPYAPPQAHSLHMINEQNATYSNAHTSNVQPNTSTNAQQRQIHSRHKTASVHTSSLIATDFKRGKILDEATDHISDEFLATDKHEEYRTNYLYQIEVTRKNGKPDRYGVGILTPQEIPAQACAQIRFPVQMTVNCEKQYKEFIAELMQQSGDGDKQYTGEPMMMKPEDCTVRLKCIPHSLDETAHKISVKAFEKIRRAHDFLFQTLNTMVPKSTPLNVCSELQNTRHYLVVPLVQCEAGEHDCSSEQEQEREQDRREKEEKEEQVSSESDTHAFHDECSYRLDYQRVKLMNIAASGKFNGTQWRQKVSRRSSLKYELVKINKGHYQKLCISYGICKERYRQNKLNGFGGVDEKQQDAMDRKSILSEWSVQSFANSSVNRRFKAMGAQNQKVMNPLSPINEGKDVITCMELDKNIANALASTACMERRKSKQQIQAEMSYERLEQAFPCAISSDFWYLFIAMPSILYHIEKWLNLIDLQQQLTLKLADGSHATIDLTLLYHALHRAKDSSIRTYQIFDCFGAYILKFLSTLHAFATDPTADIAVWRDQQTWHTRKLNAAAQHLNIASYAILHDFHWNSWHPPNFAPRGRKSLYDSKTPAQLAPGDADELYAHLMQSIIGAFWCSVINQCADYTENMLHFAIKTIMTFLHQIGVLHCSFYVHQQLKYESQHAVKSVLSAQKLRNLVCPQLQMNPLLNMALQCVCVPSESRNFGSRVITFDKLEFLGDAVLDIVLLWHIYINLADNTVPEEVVRQTEKVQWKEDMSNERHLYANDNSLGYLLWKNGPVQHINVGAMRDEVHEYIEKIAAWQKTQSPNPTLLDLLKNQKSPGGYTENESADKGENEWPLQLRAPTVLGRTVEVILGAIFLGSNYLRFVAEPFDMEPQPEWMLRDCVDFILKIYDPHLNEQVVSWNQWVGQSIADRYKL